MNCYENLKEEALKNLLKSYAGYPILTESKKEELKEAGSWIQLKVLTAHDLCEANGVKFGILELSSLFK